MKKVRVIKAIKDKIKGWQLAFEKDNEDILLNGLRNLLRLKVIGHKECYILYSTGEFPETDVEYLTFLGSGQSKLGTDTLMYEYKDDRTGKWVINVPFELLDGDEFVPPEIYFKLITINN